MLWLFAILDLVAVAAQFLYPPFRLPEFIYLGLAVIGIFWACFEVHQETSARIPTNALEVSPKIAISLLEGNEYSYDYHYVVISGKKVPGTPQAETTLPHTEIVLHIRIENTGNIAVDILSITERIEFDDPFNFMIPHAIDVEGKPIVFPIHVESSNIIFCNLVAAIYPHSIHTDAQIAARVRQVIGEGIRPKGHIDVEMAAPGDKLSSSRLGIALSLRSLCDLYITYWQKIGKAELVRLSTGHSETQETVHYLPNQSPPPPSRRVPAVRPRSARQRQSEDKQAGEGDRGEE